MVVQSIYDWTAAVVSYPGSPSHVRPLGFPQQKRSFDLMRRRTHLGAATEVHSGRRRARITAARSMGHLLLQTTVALLTLLWAGAAALVVPGDVTWLGGGGSAEDGAPDDYSRFLPLSYVLLGSGGVAVVRVLAALNEDCPSLVLLPNVTTANSSSSSSSGTPSSFAGIRVPPVQLRAEGDWTLPYAFPLKVCDARLKAPLQKAAWNAGALRLNHPKLLEKSPVIVPNDPQRYLWLSDTGLRSRPYDLGLGSTCEALLQNPSTQEPRLYGVRQCPVNLTESQLDPSTIDVDAQALADWPLLNLMKRAAEQQPDVVVFAGGALYRQGPCPAQSGVDCAGINGGGYNARNITPAELVSFLNGSASDGSSPVVTNFWPGRWGDNWFGWWSDFFFPAKALLRAAPWIVAPGDGEASACQGASSHGFYLLLSTDPYPRNTGAGMACQPSIPPFAVPFVNEQVVVMDSSRSYVEGDDGTRYATNGSAYSCPEEPSGNATAIVASPPDVSENNSPSAQTRQVDVSRLAGYWRTVEKLTASHATNILVSHRPVFGVACQQSQWISTDDVVQESLQNGTTGGDAVSALDRVSVIVSGHQRALQTLEFANQALPLQITVGHGGTKLDPDDDNAPSTALAEMVLQLAGDSSRPAASTIPVERGMETSALHGFAVVDRSSSGASYEVTLLSLDPVADAVVKLDFPLAFPPGPRVVPAPSAAPSTSRVPSASPSTRPSRSPKKTSSPARPPSSNPSDNGLSGTSGSRCPTGLRGWQLSCAVAASLAVWQCSLS